jgi:hypothetical protein
MNRPGRVLAVTFGLVAAGTILGAVAGAVAFTLAIVLSEGPTSFFVGGTVIAAAVGAVLGSVTAPAIAWLLLRHVPLGRMFVGSVVGTVVGGALGWFGAMTDITSPVWTAFAGCLAASLVMHHRARLAAGRR